MPKLGIHSLAFMPLWLPAEADTLIPKFKEHGVSVIETPLLDPDNYDTLGTRDVAEKHQMEIVCSLGLPDTLDVLNHAKETEAYLCNALEVAKSAGSSVLSGVTYGTIGKTSGAPPTQKELDAICRLVEAVAKKAASLNMALGLEPCNRYETHLLNTAGQTTALIEKTGADNVFVHLDTYHMNIEEAGMLQGFTDAGKFLGYVHLSESNRGVPGRGTIDWSAVFDALKQVKYDGTLTLESFVYLAPEIAAGLAVWRPVADRADDVVDIGLPFLRECATASAVDLG